MEGEFLPKCCTVERYVSSSSSSGGLPPVRDYAGDLATHALGMNLRALDVREWVEVDERMPHDLAEKRYLLRKHRHAVLRTLPEGDVGSRETLMLLADHLPVHYPQAYERHCDRLHNLETNETWNLARHDMHPLEVASRLVQEDLCLMGRGEADSDYILTAACVCFPTRWNLEEKIGQPLNMIHAPVPGYRNALAPTMNRLFDRLKPDRSVWRMNWSILDDPALFQPGGHSQTGLSEQISDANAGDHLWLRMERQTLRRLPVSGDILFTIRIYVQPLSVLAAQPARAAQLATALQTLDADMEMYKGLRAVRGPAVEWLQNVSLELS